MKSFFRHLLNWSEAYFILPLTILSIEAVKWFYFVQTGRSPTIAEGGIDWIVGMSPRLVQIALAIVFVSLFKQATGVWFTKEEQALSPAITIVDKVLRVVVLVIFLHVLVN